MSSTEADHVKAEHLKAQNMVPAWRGNPDKMAADIKAMAAFGEKHFGAPIHLSNHKELALLYQAWRGAQAIETEEKHKKTTADRNSMAEEKRKTDEKAAKKAKIRESRTTHGQAEALANYLDEK